MLQEHLSTWEQWGPLGAITAVQITALGVIGRWLIASKDRADAALIQLVKESQAVSTQNAAINAQTAAVLAQLALSVNKVDTRVTEVERDLESGVSQSMAAHTTTHAGIERIESALEDRPPRAGRAPLASLFLLFATLMGALLGWDRIVTPSTTRTHWTTDTGKEIECVTRRAPFESVSSYARSIAAAIEAAERVK